MYHIAFSTGADSSDISDFCTSHQIDSVTHYSGFRPLERHDGDARDFHEIIVAREEEAVLAKLYFETAVLKEVSKVPVYMMPYRADRKIANVESQKMTIEEQSPTKTQP